MEFTIRQAAEKDFPSIVAHTNKAYSVPFKEGLLVTRANDSEDGILTEIKGGTIIFVAIASDRIVGSVRCQPTGKNLKLYKLAVDPNSRNLGIGSKLVRQVLDLAGTVSAEKVVIEVAEGKGLVPFYESLGFTTTKKTVVRDHNEVVMEKKIIN